MKFIFLSMVLFFSCQQRFIYADEVKTIITEKYAHPIIEIRTELGNLKYELYEDKTPNTVANFLILVENGFYNGQKFHRIVDQFLIQGGCPNTKPGAAGKFGTGDPGYTIAEEIHPELKHDFGMLTMARKRTKGTTASQFCLFLDKAEHLDGEYTVFGKLIDGKETLTKIAKLAGPRGVPTEYLSYNIVVISKNKTPYTIKKNPPVK